MSFQITEVQLPWRRRGDEYKQEALPQGPIESRDSGTEHGPTRIRDAMQKKHDRYYGVTSQRCLP